MTLAFLQDRAWLDYDGQHIWLEHQCIDGADTSMLPWPAWHAKDGKVWPSINCGKCGAHYFASLDTPAHEETAK